MSIITESKEIKAFLLVQGTSYPMLDVNPHKHNELHFLLREHAFQFLIVYQGFAQPIIVGREGFAILPMLEPIILDVKYIVEGEEEQLKQIQEISPDKTFVHPNDLVRLD